MDNFELRSLIARRAQVELREANIFESITSLVMDLEIAGPLRLQEMLNSDDENFTHDIFGIYRHLNRKTGELENCFVPRFHDGQALKMIPEWFTPTTKPGVTTG